MITDFIHTDDPGSVPVRVVPDHLKDHDFMHRIHAYHDTGEDTFLDQAGKILCPEVKEDFGWYVLLTK